MVTPALLIGSLVGMKIHIKVGKELFRNIVAFLLLIVSIVLLIWVLIFC